MTTRAGVPDPAFWAGRRVLVTGHTGFKGSWLTLWLTLLGARVQGLSLPGAGVRERLWDSLGLTLEDEIRGDVVAPDWNRRVKDFSPEVVVHLAAQSLVVDGYREPFETFSTNVLGTARVLDFATGHPGVEAVLVVTTDKVYDPRQAVPHHESAFLGGADPYSASKAAAELVVGSWPRTDARVVAGRAGNVIGGGDWSPDRLVPDLVRAWSDSRVASLRRPEAVRPWQHVLEPLAGYLVYLEAAVAGSVDLPRALNFGPTDHQRVSVQDLVSAAANIWADLHELDEPPRFVEQSSEVSMAETGELLIDSSAAQTVLGWSSRLDWRAALTLTLEWYSASASGVRPYDLSATQIQQYVAGLS